ncbi:MAG: hypothetical protein LBN39_07725 [Planctomycetaceae bacterium]|jgi:hypothetical protein|nr:hypothetical protein [Planctomycetaceae bacterium]
MSDTLNAWIQLPDYSSYDIGTVSKDEAERRWDSRWAQKCIRDAAEEVAINRFSPYKKSIGTDFCPPQLGFENGNATLAVSPAVDVNPAILYGAPLQEFNQWTVCLNIKGGRKICNCLAVNYSFEKNVSAAQALDLVRIFYDTVPEDLVPAARKWRKQTEEPDPFHFITALFL